MHFWMHIPKNLLIEKQLVLEILAKKRAAGTVNANTPKKARSETPTLDVLSLDQLEQEGTEMMSVELIGLKTSAGGCGRLSVRTQSNLFLTNPHAEDLKVQEGAVLIGFGKINFRQLKEGQSPLDPKKDVAFAPANNEEHIIVDGIYTTIGTATKLQG